MTLSDNDIREKATAIVIDYLGGLEYTSIYDHPACPDLIDDVSLDAIHAHAQHLLAELARALRDPVGHDYLSTACWHATQAGTPPERARFLHRRCRHECKWCASLCRCACHSAAVAA
ncbi:hypothetical protein [Nocardia sp. NPDC056564]